MHSLVHLQDLIPTLAGINNMQTRVESVSHLLIHTHWPIKQSGCDPLWPNCWSFLSKSDVKWHGKNQIWKSAIDFFILDNPMQLCTKFLTMKSLDTTCFQTAWGSILQLVSHLSSDGSVYSPDPRFLIYQMPMSFSKEHVIY